MDACADTTKLLFRKLNSILCDEVGGEVKMAASVVIVIGGKRFLLASRKASCAGIRIVTFEACIGFTLLRPAGSLSHPRRPLSRGSSPDIVTRPSRSSASRSIDNSLGGILLHRCFAPSGARPCADI